MPDVPVPADGGVTSVLPHPTVRERVAGLMAELEAEAKHFSADAASEIMQAVFIIGKHI